MKLIAIISFFLFITTTSPALAVSCVTRNIEDYPIILKAEVKSSFGIPAFNFFFPNFQKISLENVEIYKGQKRIKEESINKNRLGLSNKNLKKNKVYIFFLDVEEQNLRATFCNRIVEVEEHEYSQTEYFQKQLPDLSKYLNTKANLLKPILAGNPNYYNYQGLARFYAKQGENYAAEDAYLQALDIKYGYYREKNKSIQKAAFDNEEFWKEELKETGFTELPLSGSLIFEYGEVLFKRKEYNRALNRFRLIKDSSREAKKHYQLTLLMLGMFGNQAELDLSGLTIKGIKLEGLIIDRVNLQDTTVHGLTLSNTIIKNGNFTNSKIRHFRPENSILENTLFKNSTISGNSKNSKFINSNFENADIYWYTIHNTSFRNSNFHHSKIIIHNKYSNVDFSNADLTGAYVHRLKDININGAILDSLNNNYSGGYPVHWQNTDLTNINLSKSDLRGADLSNSKFIDANLSGANLLWSHSIKTNLKGANFSGANLEGAAMALALYDCNTIFPEGFDPVAHYLVPDWGKCEKPIPHISFENLKLPIDGFKMWGDAFRFEKTKFRDVSFKNMEVPSFKCKKCDLRNASFENVRTRFVLEDSDLRGTSFEGAEFLKRGRAESRFKGAKYNKNTKWPTGFSPKEAGAVYKK